MEVDEASFKAYFLTYGVITQDELNLFEAGGMAPTAYTYLMSLTYSWHLAESKSDEDRFVSLANSFRSTGYQTTGNPSIDENIAYMPSLPANDLTKEQHYFRNKLNIEYNWDTFQKLQCVLPDHLQWAELPFEQSAFHKFGQSAFHKFGQINNRKYVSPDGHFEMVFTKENYLVNESFSSDNMGTYNYYGP